MPITINGTGTISGLSVGGLPDGTVQPADLSTGAPVWDTSGNVGIGTSSPQSRLHIVGAATAFATGGDGFHAGATGGYAQVEMAGSTGGYIDFSRGNGTDFQGRILYDNVNNVMTFSVNSTERARIDSSGNLLVGQTVASGVNANSLSLEPSSGRMLIQHLSGTATSTRYLVFTLNAVEIGSVTQNGTTAVAYNTTSDHRLKQNVQPLSGALAKVAALKPSEFDWIDGRHDDGFIAHELQAVLPNVVTGDKDAVNEDGTPKYQQVDYARIVPTLTAAIQELNQKVEAQAVEIAALKGAA